MEQKNRKNIIPECEGCEYVDECYYEEPDFDDTIAIGLYLTEDEVNWLRNELDIFDLMTEDKDIIYQAIRLNGVLEYLLDTHVIDYEE